MINETKLMFDLGILKHFINDALKLSYKTKSITGFEMIVPLLEASSHNSYIENVGNKADSIYLRAKEVPKIRMAYAYLGYIRRISEKFSFKDKKAILAFDYTDENFYGNVQGLDIHGWTGEDAITGHFKFITCSLISDDIPEKIPLISLPIRLGHYKSSVILHCLTLIKDYIGEIELILFDRGFYDKDLMYELEKCKYPYLIFVPKHDDKKSILYSLDEGTQVAIYNEFEVNKDKSTFQGENILVFLKQIYDPKSEKKYDWVFATNVKWILLEKIITTYKKRWRIETQFRVQDEARIKCKSPEMEVRYFLFLFEQMLQVQWICFFKNECPFKEFLIAMANMSHKWTKS